MVCRRALIFQWGFGYFCGLLRGICGDVGASRGIPSPSIFRKLCVRARVRVRVCVEVGRVWVRVCVEVGRVLVWV